MCDVLGSFYLFALLLVACAGITKNEMVLWHQQYLACCVELNQWDTVVEYAKVTDNCPLQIDAMVQLHDWQTLKTVSRQVQHLCLL